MGKINIGGGKPAVRCDKARGSLYTQIIKEVTSYELVENVVNVIGSGYVSFANVATLSSSGDNMKLRFNVDGEVGNFITFQRGNNDHQHVWGNVSIPFFVPFRFNQSMSMDIQCDANTTTTAIADVGYSLD